MIGCIANISTEEGSTCILTLKLGHTSIQRSMTVLTERHKYYKTQTYFLLQNLAAIARCETFRMIPVIFMTKSGI